MRPADARGAFRTATFCLEIVPRYYCWSHLSPSTVHLRRREGVRTGVSLTKLLAMKRICLALAAAALTAPALAGTDVGVSVGISQPGFYGRIDIGSVGAPPVLIYPQPVIIARPAMAVVQRPIYLRVPPGHAKHWGKHCAHYDACGQPVYFVQEDWYQNHYDAAGPGKGHGRGKGQDRRG
jgi:hypothetical protein